MPDRSIKVLAKAVKSGRNNFLQFRDIQAMENKKGFGFELRWTRAEIFNLPNYC
jgi:hypothetical protein